MVGWVGGWFVYHLVVGSPAILVPCAASSNFLLPVLEQAIGLSDGNRNRLVILSMYRSICLSVFLFVLAVRAVATNSQLGN